MSDRAQALQRSLRIQIPLAEAMQVRVVSADPARIVLAAPLAPNANHLGTFFGGSTVVLAPLAAWALAEERLAAEGVEGHVVVQRSAIEYLEPASAELRAECVAPADEAWNRFLVVLRRRGRGRIELDVDLTSEGVRVGAFRGSFVATLDK